MPLSTQDCAQLNAVIGKLKAFGDSDYRLLIEHLETASAYLLGAMPSECTHNLKLAQGSAERLSGKPLPSELGDTIAAVLKDLKSPQAKASSNEISAFFQRAGVSFGIFYPTRHVVAVFPSVEATRSGLQVLCYAGFRLWETIVVPGEEAEKFLEELRAHGSLWTGLMTEVSRLPQTEAAVVDRYAQLAQTGGGFLVAHAPGEDEATNISQLLHPLQPIEMHWFMPGYIREMI
jgi:hypothetical protein